VRKPNKISQERLYEMAKKLYLVQIMVEGYECDDGESSKPDDDGDDQDGGGEETNDDADDLDDSLERMDIEKKAGAGNQGQSRNRNNNTGMSGKQGSRASDTLGRQKANVEMKVDGDARTEGDPEVLGGSEL
jgi:hypothetical protein